MIIWLKRQYKKSLLLLIVLAFIVSPKSTVSLFQNNQDIKNLHANSNLITNGDFEESADFSSWTPTSWSTLGKGNIVNTTAFTGNRCANLSINTSNQRIGYQQIVQKPNSSSLFFSFTIQHNAGRVFQAGISISFLDITYEVLGRTFWHVSNESGNNNNSRNLFFDIRNQSTNEWYTVTSDLSNSVIRPTNISDISVVSYFQVDLVNYGVSSYGENLSILYDNILLGDIIARNPLFDFINNELPSIVIFGCITGFGFFGISYLQKRNRKQKKNRKDSPSLSIDSLESIDDIEAKASSSDLEKIPQNLDKTTDSESPTFENESNTEKPISVPWYLLFLTPILWLIGRILYPPEIRRMSESDVTNNPIRREILYILKEYEFEHFRGLKRQVKCSTSTLLWHLQVLNDFSKVKEQKIGQYKIFFLKSHSVDANKVQLYCSLRTRNVLRMLAYLVHNSSPITPDEMMKRLNLSYDAFRYNIKKLKSLEILYHDKENNTYKLNLQSRSILRWLLERYKRLEIA